jgi:hypothetical protein
MPALERSTDQRIRQALAASGAVRQGRGMSIEDSPLPVPASLEDAILTVLSRPGTGTLSAPELAHAIAPEGDWHALLLPIRRAAVALALAGRLIIYRKGKPADPSDFRGVYRLGLPRHD